MSNLISFINAFLSYLLLFGVCIAVVAAAIALGIFLRKKHDAQGEKRRTEPQDGDSGR